MKRTLFTSLMMAFALWANAYDIEVDGIGYNLIAKAKVAEIVEITADNLGDFVIPAKVEADGVEYSVTTIAENAFYGRMDLTSIHIPASIRFIEENAFYACRSLANVYIEDLEAWFDLSTSPSPVFSNYRLFLNGEELTELAVPNSVISIRDYAFDGCSSIHSVTILENTKTIGIGAFALCENITDVVIEGNLEEIGASVFSGCSSLSSIDIPSSVQTIGQQAFNGCKSLSAVHIPEGVSEIGFMTFANCETLQTISFPSSITTIGEVACYNCPALVDVYCYAGQVPSLQENTFEGSEVKYATLHVPTESVSYYKDNPYWGEFMAIVPLTDTSIEAIGAAEGSQTIYTLNGVRHQELQQGVNIVRTAHGKIKKMLKK